MENLKDIYKQATNIDIEKQQRIWDERGKGYYGEYLLFSRMYSFIDVKSKILMNLEIPIDSFHKTEIDLLLIHETGIYVFEAKHYKGTIYGKDSDNTWTQFFKTTSNKTFRNPLVQNGYHIRALENILPNMPIYSVIVFTNEDADIRVENTNPYVEICNIYSLEYTMNNLFQRNSKKILPEEINSIFKNLCQYSPMIKPPHCDAKEAPIGEWFAPLLEDIKIQKEKLKKETKKFIIYTAISISTCVLVSILSFVIFSGYYTSKTRELEQKYLMVEEQSNENLDLLHSSIEVNEEKFSSFSDEVTFEAKLELTNNSYKMKIGEKSKYVVFTKSGEIYEYNMFGDLYYSEDANTLSHDKKTGRLRQKAFEGIKEISDVTYIKITDISLYNATSNALIENGLELELYSNK